MTGRWKSLTPETVLGDFDNQQFVYHDTVSKLVATETIFTSKTDARRPAGAISR